MWVVVVGGGGCTHRHAALVADGQVGRVCAACALLVSGKAVDGGRNGTVQNFFRHGICAVELNDELQPRTAGLPLT